MSIDFHSAVKTFHPNHFIGFYAFLCLLVFISNSMFSDWKFYVQATNKNTSKTEKNINIYFPQEFTSGLGYEIVRFSTNIPPKYQKAGDLIL